LVKDRVVVHKNTLLAFIENSANYKNFLLKSFVNTINIGKSRFPFEKSKETQFGDLKNYFTAFKSESIAHNLNAKLQPYRIEGIIQSYKAIDFKKWLNLLEKQKIINQNKLELEKSDLERYQSLF